MVMNLKAFGLIKQTLYKINVNIFCDYNLSSIEMFIVCLITFYCCGNTS